MRAKTFFSLFAAVLFLGACAATPNGSSATTGNGQQAVTGATTGNGNGQQTANIGVRSDRVFFDTDQAGLKPEARATIETWVGWLKANPTATVTIAGHTDERGTREYNLALGEKRAASTRNYMIALGVDGSRVRTISYGKERPQVPGHNEAAWRQNRRAVMVRN